ncbi:MAG: amidohydrolase family protein [Gemmatimonadetes bacterium]|nr:amidohydrolase family protein [Gemmatimonadota bacterium]NIO33346.1 amidohydrolase family protein [Gemmatimonadota bacterium]
MNRQKGKMTTGVPIAIAIVIAIVVGSATASAQHDPRVEPAPTYVIQGATIHTLAGAPIEKGSVVVSGRVIVEVGANVAVPAGASVIDAAGLNVYPGMVDAYSRLGLTEIGSVAVTSDASDLGNWNPHLRAYDAIYPASEHIPVARANGVTHALSAPGGGGGFRGGGSAGIAGQAALIHLDGYTVEDMAINPSFGMIISWPTIQTRSFDFATFQRIERPYNEAKREYDERIQELESWFQAAQHYKQAVENGDPTNFDRDLQLEQLARTIGGELPVIVSTNDKRGIESAVEFAERYDLRLILARARDARKVKDVLAEKGIPVILGPTQSLPANEDDPYHYPFSLAGELYEAGVKICFGTFNSSASRTLPYEAANAVPFGLPYEEALRAVTINTAEIFRLADRLGTIETGKLGNLMITDGDPLEYQTQVEYVFINGIPVDTDNRHRRLWEYYKARPQPETPTATARRNGG